MRIQLGGYDMQVGQTIEAMREGKLYKYHYRVYFFLMIRVKFRNNPFFSSTNISKRPSKQATRYIKLFLNNIKNSVKYLNFQTSNFNVDFKNNSISFMNNICSMSGVEGHRL